MNVYDTLKDSVERFPDRIAIHDEFGALTYRDLFLKTEATKASLVKLGVQKDCGIALLADNNRNFIVGLYAGLACGAVMMPVSKQQQQQEIDEAINQAQLHFIVTDQKEPAPVLTGQLPVRCDETFTVIRLNKSLEEKTVPFVDDVAFMRFTSGTTGEAKCVILSHRSALERIEAANKGLNIDTTDNVVWVLPMAYHFIVSIVLYIRYGAGIIICKDFLADHIIQQINGHRGTFLYASPMHIRLLASHPESAQLPSLRRVISTTTAVHPHHCHAFKDKFGIPVNQAFGIIEVGLPCINFEKADKHPEAVGKPLPSYLVEILDEEYNILPHNTTGLLAIKGPGMFDGYLSPPVTRSEVLRKGWFITGDYATKTADGLIEIRGRKKSMINISGNKVFPDEVEAVINLFPGVVQSKVYGQPHVLFGEIVVAEIIFKKGEETDAEQVILHCRKHLSGFKVPQRIKKVAAIEMTSSGKIKRS